MHGAPGDADSAQFPSKNRGRRHRGQRGRDREREREGESVVNIRESRRNRTGISNCLQRATGQPVVGTYGKRSDRQTGSNDNRSPPLLSASFSLSFLEEHATNLDFTGEFRPPL